MIPAAPPAPTSSGDATLLRGLARRQIVATLLIALVAGLTAGAIELTLEWRNLRQRIDASVRQSALLVRDSAAEAAFNINTEQAQSVARGLLRDPVVANVRLVDNFGTVLADLGTPPPAGFPVALPLPANSLDVAVNLDHREADGKWSEVGRLEIRADIGLAAGEFQRLAGVKLLLRVGEALLLSTLLALAFFRGVIRPLTVTARHVGEVDPAAPAARPIPIPDHHQDDEFGSLARTLNELLAEFQHALDRQAEAQAALHGLNTQLESMIEARTAELRHTLVELEAKKEAAEQAARSKSDFLATISHELRTPMNGILGCVDLLGMGQLDDEQREFLGIVRASGNHLLELINDILDYSRMEGGGIDLALEPVVLADIVRQAVQMQAAPATEKSLRVDLPPLGDELAVLADARRLLQVLTNLIGNAIKFTAAGGITIAAERRDAMVRVAVTDTGIGIAEVDLPKLFIAFSQVDASATRRYGGTGLGLAICKRLLEAMGGSVGVESVPGRGSTFWFELPAA